MASTRTARTALRAATRRAHDQVDLAYSGFELGDASSYRRFLLAQGAAQLAVEAALETAGIERVLPDWRERRRAAALLADLADLGAETPAEVAPPKLKGEPAMLGAVYVLEGSRFGGQLLARSVAKDLPTRYLGASDPAGWRRLMALINKRLSNPEEIAIAIEAARNVFELFELSSRLYPKASSVDE